MIPNSADSVFSRRAFGGSSSRLPFWKHPIDRLVYMFRFFLDNTQNLEVLYFGAIYKSAINVPWHYALGYLGVTTPLPTLLFFILGLLTIIGTLFKTILTKHQAPSTKSQTSTKHQISNILKLEIGSEIGECHRHSPPPLVHPPLTRYLNPKIGVIDGSTAFEE